MTTLPSTKTGLKRLSLVGIGNSSGKSSLYTSGDNTQSNSRNGSAAASRRTSISSVAAQSFRRGSSELSRNEVHIINKPETTSPPNELNHAKVTEDEFVVDVPVLDSELLSQAAIEFDHASQKIHTTLTEILTKYGIKYTADATIKTICTELSIAHSRQLKIYADQISIIQNALQKTVTMINTMKTAHGEQIYNIRTTEAERLRRLRREQKSLCEKVKRETEENLKKVWEEGQPERERANQRLIDERVRAIITERDRDRKQREELEAKEKAILKARMESEREEAEIKKQEDERKRRIREEERESKLKSAAALCKEMERKWREEKDTVAQLNARLNTLQKDRDEDREEVKKLRDRLHTREQNTKEERDQFMEKVQVVTADATTVKRELFKARNQLKETEDSLHTSKEKHKVELETISRKLKLIVEKKDKQIDTLQGHNAQLADRLHVLEEYFKTHKQELQALQTM
jgi:hypothetical protein